MPGPVPKRESQRRRVNKPTTPVTRAEAGPQESAPPADAAWHPIAGAWYAALSRSGQSRWYEASDWAQAVYVAEVMSRSLTADRMSAPLFAAVISSSGNLLVTEGDRRRLRIELDRGAAVDEDEDASVAALSDFRARLSG